MLLITLVCTLPFAYARVRKHLYEKQEFQMVEHIRSMASKLANKDSIESALKSAADTGDLAGRKIAKCIRMTNEGMELSEAFRNVAKKEKSLAFGYLASLVRMSQDSNAETEKAAKSIASDLARFRNMEHRFESQVNVSIFALQLLVIFAIPYALFLVSEIIQIPVMQLSEYFILFCVVLFSFLDYFINDDYMESLFKLPLFISLYYLSIKVVVPSILPLML
jgi:coenzyme F420-reducing hydrogenase delta subunit